MKEHVRQVLELAAVYLVVLIVVDSILASYAVLTWLALGIAFLIFSVFFLDVLLELTPKKFIKPVQFHSRNEDELVTLESLTRQALDSEHPAASALLSERVRSLALRAVEYRTSLTGDQLRDMTQYPAPVRELFQGRQPGSAILTDDSIIKPGDKREMDKLLNLVEDWLL